MSKKESEKLLILSTTLLIANYLINRIPSKKIVFLHGFGMSFSGILSTAASLKHISVLQKNRDILKAVKNGDYSLIDAFLTEYIGDIIINNFMTIIQASINKAYDVNSNSLSAKKDGPP